MRIILTAICLVTFVAGKGNSAVVDRWIAGQTSQCSCKEGSAEENHTAWHFPHISFRWAKVTRSVNRKIAIDVLKAIELTSFPSDSSPCECEGSEFVFRTQDYCEPTYVSESYVTLRCSTEGYTNGKGGTNYRTILLKIHDRESTRLKPSELFRNDAAVQAIEKTLAERITNDYKAEKGYPNGKIDEADIPGLAEAMVKSGVLVAGGMQFLVLGRGHSAFKTMLSTEDLREFLAPAILQELTSPTVSHRP